MSIHCFTTIRLKEREDMNVLGFILSLPLLRYCYTQRRINEQLIRVSLTVPGSGSCLCSVNLTLFVCVNQSTHTLKLSSQRGRKNPFQCFFFPCNLLFFFFFSFLMVDTFPRTIGIVQVRTTTLFRI